MGQNMMNGCCHDSWMTVQCWMFGMGKGEMDQCGAYTDRKHTNMAVHYHHPYNKQTIWKGPRFEPMFWTTGLTEDSELDQY
jgi:hypothetical protein